MPLRLTDFDKAGLASLNRWARDIETKIKGVNTDTSYVNALGERAYTLASAVSGYNFIGTWDASTKYVVGNQVVYSGSYYVCLVTNINKEPDLNPGYWQFVGTKQDGVYLGTYNSATAYVPDNQVSYLGSFWVCLNNTTGNAPAIGSSYWLLLGTSTFLFGAWSSTTAYSTGNEVSYNGNVYQALQANINKQPDTNPTYWQLMGPSTLDNVADGTTYAKTTFITGQSFAIDDPNFNLGVQQWKISGSITATQASASPATNGMSMEMTTTQQYAAMIYKKRFKVSPGDIIYFSAYLKSDGTFSVYGEIVGYDGAGTPTYNLCNLADSTSTSWTLESQTATIPPNIQYIEIWFARADAGGLSQNAWVTDVQLTRVVSLDTEVQDGLSYARYPMDTSSSTDLPFNGNFNFFPDTQTVALGWTKDYQTTGSGWGYGRSANTATGGPYSQEIINNGASGGVSLGSQPFGVTAGQQYHFSVYANSSVANPGTMYFSAVWYSSDTNFTYAGKLSEIDIVTAGGPTLSATWQQFTATLTAPVNAKFCIIKITNWSGTSCTISFSATRVIAPNYGGNSSYRPLSNMLTGHDAGSNATINIAAWTNRIAGIGDISINSGSITGLSYSTLYYVYYDDSDLLGGAVSYQYSTTKADAIHGAGRFFVGSILTPASGGADTVGNNDGGVGAQFGFNFNIFESAYASTATSGSGLALSNPQNMVDGNLNDYGTLTTSLAGSGYVIFSGMQLGVAGVSSLTLNIKTQISTNTNSTMALAYSTDNGSTWTNIYSVTTTRALTTDSVSLAVTQPLSAVLVRFTGTYNSSGIGVCNFYGAYVKVSG